MSEMVVEKIHENEEAVKPTLEKLENLLERVRQRAFEIFENRGSTIGNDLDDWFKAEHELIWAPAADLIEKDGKFELQITVPGFEANQVNVTAFPDSVVVHADCTHKHEQSEGDLHFCECGERRLYRRLVLPSRINVDKVTAALDKGVLRITADKTQATKETETAAGGAKAATV